MTYRRPGARSFETAIPAGPIGAAGVKIPCFIGKSDNGLRSFSKELTRGTTVGGNDQLMTEDWRVTELPDEITDQDLNTYYKDTDYTLYQDSNGVNYVRWSDDYTKLLLHCDGTDGSTSFPDASGQAHVVTANGDAQVDTADKKFGTGSCLLDGTDDWLSVAATDDFNFGTGDFAVDCWVNLNEAIGTTVQQLFHMTDGTGVFSVYFQEAGGQDQIDVVVTAGGPPLVNQKRDVTMVTGTWYHIAITRSGDTIRIFLDGTQLGDDVTISGSVMAANASLTIGDDTTSTNELDGWVDEFRISKGVARWTENFTVPTQEYSLEPAAGKTYQVNLYEAQEALSASLTRANSGDLDAITGYTAQGDTQGPNYQVNFIPEEMVIETVTYTYGVDYTLYQDTTGNYIQWIAGGSAPAGGTAYDLTGFTAIRVSPTFRTVELEKGGPDSQELITVALDDVRLLNPEIVVGGITYTLDEDFQLTKVGDLSYVDWSVSGGSEPAEGLQYELTYQSNDYRPYKYFQARNPQEDYAMESNLGIVAELAFNDNNCREAYFCPLRSESVSAFQDALDLIKGKSDLDIVVCVRSDTVLTSDWNAIDAAARVHVLAMSEPEEGKERRYNTGVRKDVNGATVKARAEALDNRRVTVVYPHKGQRAISTEDGEGRTVWLNGSFLAAAQAALNGSHGDPAHPIAAQQVAGFIQLGINPDTGIEFLDSEITDIAGSGVQFLLDNEGVISIDDDLTTDLTDKNTNSEQVQYIRDYVPQRIRENVYNAVKGRRFNEGVLAIAKATAANTMDIMLNEPQIVREWDRTSLTVEEAPNDPEKIIVRLRYKPIRTVKYVDVYVTVDSSL